VKSQKNPYAGAILPWSDLASLFFERKGGTSAASLPVRRPNDWQRHWLHGLTALLFGANHDIQRTRADCSRISSRRPAGATAWARRDQLRARTQARAHFFVLCLRIGISQQFRVGDHFAKNRIAIRCVCVSLTWSPTLLAGRSRGAKLRPRHCKGCRGLFLEIF
jgi:hypothetical protein